MLKQALQHLHDIVLHILTAASSQYLNEGMTAFDIDDGEVTGGLHHVGIGGYHTYHAVMTGVDGVDEVVLYLDRNLHGWGGCLLGIELDVALNALVLILEVVKPVVDQPPEGHPCSPWAG